MYNAGSPITNEGKICHFCKAKELGMILPYYFSDPDRSVSRTCKPSSMGIKRINRRTVEEPTSDNERTIDEHISNNNRTPGKPGVWLLAVDPSSLWVEFNFRTSQVTISKPLFTHLLADTTKHVDFLFDGKLCYVTKGKPGRGVLCTGVRSIRFWHPNFVEQRRLAWERGSDETLRVEVSSESVVIPDLDISTFPDPIYSLII